MPTNERLGLNDLERAENVSMQAVEKRQQEPVK